MATDADNDADNEAKKDWSIVSPAPATMPTEAQVLELHCIICRPVYIHIYHDSVCLGVWCGAVCVLHIYLLWCPVIWYHSVIWCHFIHILTGNWCADEYLPFAAPFYHIIIECCTLACRDTYIQTSQLSCGKYMHTHIMWHAYIQNVEMSAYPTAPASEESKLLSDVRTSWNVCVCFCLFRSLSLSRALLLA